MRAEVITSGREETERLAETLAEHIESPCLILLDGDLAAGKTCFVRGFTRGLGSTDDTSSPTFTLLNVYDSPKGTVNHLDLYRIGDPDELYAIGFEDYLDAITLVEWPAVAGEELRERADLIIEIDVIDDETRRFRIEGLDQSLYDLLSGGQDE